MISPHSTVTETDRFVAPYEVGWNGDPLSGGVIGLDTETVAFASPHDVPQLVLVVASDGERTLIIHPDDARRFLIAHRDGHFVFHNVAFDFWVLERHFRSRDDDDATRLLWHLALEDKLHDSMILDMLLRLGESDAFPVPRSLKDVAAEYAGIKLNKQDPYRLRFGEIVGMALEDVELGFFEYAAADPLATLHAYAELVERAEWLLREEAGFCVHEAAMEFGLLTEAIQVKAAIALAHVERLGVSLDLDRFATLRSKLGSDLQKKVNEIQEFIKAESAFREFPQIQENGLFKLNADGLVQFSEKGTPKLHKKSLQLILKLVVRQIEQAESRRLNLPRTERTGEISTSADHWAELRSHHPFVRLWQELVEIQKLAQFSNSLNEAVVHPRYHLLARTGRTRCSNPNLQQLPRNGGIRECVVPSAGHLLLAIDYSFIELRTLAAECQKRYGASQLAEVIRQGVDPHCYTAAMIRGISPEDFEALKGTDPDAYAQDRQRAKAINFGIPGGLGVQALVDYAKSTYGVEMSHEEAGRLRNRLTREVYPELERYLADDGMAILAKNLRSSEPLCWEAFDFSGEQANWVVGALKNVVRGKTTKRDGTPYDPRWFESIWDGLIRLNANSELAPRLAARQGSPDLCDRLFRSRVVTTTGRIRGRVSFTQARNTPFQGLAADGAKLALFELARRGFRVVAFIHDEFLIELPEQGDHRAMAEQISGILCESMERVLDGVPAGCSYALMRRWFKSAKPAYDGSGNLIPWEPST